MIAEKKYVACTMMVKDETGRYVFLVMNKDNEFSFPSTSVKPKKTGLACVIERMKEHLNIEVDYLELNECTNILVDEESVPLYVFTYEDQTIENPNDLLLEDTKLSWLHAENLTNKLEQWEISGVPQFMVS